MDIKKPKKVFGQGFYLPKGGFFTQTSWLCCVDLHKIKQ